MFGLQIIPAKLFVCRDLEQILLLKGEHHYQVVMLDDRGHQKLPQISLPGGNGVHPSLLWSTESNSLHLCNILAYQYLYH